MSTVESYLSSKAAFERVDGQIRTLGSLIASVGSALANQPERMIFSNVPTGLPADVAMNPSSLSFNADDWKAPDQIQKLLAEWHRAKSAMTSAWQLVPEEMKPNLVAPTQARLEGIP